ncbi:MAG TPA: ATP-binding protein [Steroidobacteraceae bacterium]|nr:ATP-binding protein [Steroidobacteraceae bacterium]
MPAPHVEIRFAGTHAGFAEGFARLHAALDVEGLEGAARYNTELVFEEIIANIVKHGAHNGREPDVCVTLQVLADSIVLGFSDDGLPFDPRGRADPVMPRSLAEAKIGGFGLLLVRHATSSLDYARTADDRNRLTAVVPRG